MPPGLSHIIKTGVGQAANIPGTITTKDDNDGFVHNAADRDPFETVNTGEEVRHGYQQVGAVDLIEPDKGPVAPAVRKAAKGPRKKRQPFAQVFTAYDAAQQVVVRMARQPLIGAKIVLVARPFKSRRIRADAVEQGCGQTGAGPQAQGLKIPRHDGAGGAKPRPDVAERGVQGRDRAARGRRQGVVVNDAVEGNALKCLVVVRLRIHDGKARVLVGLFGLPGAHGDAQVPYHGQIVGPGHFIDAGDIGIVHPGQKKAFQSHGRGQCVRIGIDENAPAVIFVQILSPVLHMGDNFGSGQHYWVILRGTGP